jgi:hypothetical protein
MDHFLSKLKIVVLLFALSIPGSAAAQAPVIEWEHSLGGSFWDYASAIVNTRDGGYAVVGSTGSNDGDVSGLKFKPGASFNAWVVKLTSSGTVAWQKVLGGSGGEEANAIQQTRDGGFVIAGWTDSFDDDVKNHNDQFLDSWIVKLDSLGKIQWQYCYGDNNGDHESFSVTECADGGFAAAGWIQQCIDSGKGGPIGPLHGEIIKLTSTGKLVWHKFISTADYGFALTGTAELSYGHASDDVWILKLDSTGVIEWTKAYGGSQSDIGCSIIEASNEAGNGYAVVASTGSADGDLAGTKGELWIMRLDLSGALVWQQVLSVGGTSDLAFVRGTSITETQDGSYAVTCASHANGKDVSTSKGKDDFYIAQFSENGKLLWNNSYGGTNDEFARSIIATPDGGFALAGVTLSNDGDVSGFHGDEDAWVVKLRPAHKGVQVQESISNFSASLSPSLGTGNGYLDVASVTSLRVNVTIYNQLGQLISSLPNFPSSTQHHAPFDLTNFPSGNYYFRIQSAAESKILVFKLVK